jgi:glyoxylase-like metal-dependent hydrolase (beta-lactamase superfamily II)
MQGFMGVYGDDAQERFGEMVPIEEDRFVLVEDGESIVLGERELKVIHTPGHDPNHLCFLDTRSRGLFCGDALGGYFSDVEISVPSSAPGSDPIRALQSIEKLQKKYYFSLTAVRPERQSGLCGYLQIITGNVPISP